MKNGVDLRHTNELGGRSDSKNEPTGSWMNKIRAGFAFVTVEPFLICFTLAPAISPVAFTTLLLEKACRVDLNYTKEDCYEWDDNVTTQSKLLVKDVTTWGNTFQRCTVAIVLLFVGAWSDLTGSRKALMVMPILGSLVSVFGLMLATYFFEELPLFVTSLINLLPVTLSGGYYVAMIGSYCHLADVTSLETRTFRMGIASTAMALCNPVVRAIRPKFDNLNYYAFFGATATLNFLGLLYTYFMIHDVKPMEIEAPWYKKIMRFCNPENAWSTISIAYKSVQDRAKILLIIAAYFVICGPIYGKGSIMYEYFTQHFLMKDAEYVVFTAYYAQLMGTCGILLTVTLFSKYLKMHDAIIGIIAAASIVISSCIYALAPNTLWLYSGPLIGLIGGSSITVIQSLGTKVVSPQHIAKVFSLLCLTQAIIPEIYQPMYITMYNNTKHIMMGAVYLLGAAMTAPAILIFIVIYKQLKKEERDRVTAPQNKELSADENYVTSL